MVGDDVDLLHRKALALVHRQDYSAAEQIINTLLQKYPVLNTNPELASLEGRIHREIWLVTKDDKQLDEAFDAYYRAYKANPSQYYPGINAAELALYKGDADLAGELLNEILKCCLELQRQPVVSYWVDFTVGQIYLGLGNTVEALENYKLGLSRNPSPPIRDRESALGGASRMIEANGLVGATTSEVEKVLAL